MSQASSNHIFTFCRFHDIGSFGKETSCYFQAVSGRNVIADNVCYNGPRAGFNFNDGFLGGNDVTGNLIFNMVRETSDHGGFNSWDRTPYLTRKPNGSVTALPLWNRVAQNLIINGHNGVWTLDHDDGSSFYNDTGNVLFYGGCKNFRGNNKRCGPDNLIVYPGIPSRSSGGRTCQTNDNVGFAFDEYTENDCVTWDGKFYSFGTVKKRSDAPFTASNRFYSPNGSWAGTPSLVDLQRMGLDIGSIVRDVLQPSTIEAMARKLLKL